MQDYEEQTDIWTLQMEDVQAEKICIETQLRKANRTIGLLAGEKEMLERIVKYWQDKWEIEANKNHARILSNIPTKH